MQFKPIVFVAAVLLAVASAAYAKGPVSGTIQAFIVSQDSDGNEKVVAADTAEPGQVMEFKIVFTNEGDSAVSGIQVVDPIPSNTTYVAQSHRADVNATFEVSIDGGESFEGVPVTRIETQADGTQKKVVVPPAEYTHLRWKAADKLASDGGKHSFAYRVVVD